MGKPTLVGPHLSPLPQGEEGSTRGGRVKERAPNYLKANRDTAVAGNSRRRFDAAGEDAIVIFIIR